MIDCGALIKENQIIERIDTVHDGKQPETDESIRIQVFAPGVEKLKRQEVLEILDKAMARNPPRWVLKRKGRYKLLLDELSHFFPELSDVDWLVGSHYCRPAYQCASHVGDSIGLTYYNPSVVFTIYKEELIPPIKYDYSFSKSLQALREIVLLFRPNITKWIVRTLIISGIALLSPMFWQQAVSVLLRDKLSINIPDGLPIAGWILLLLGLLIYLIDRVLEGRDKPNKPNAADS